MDLEQQVEHLLVEDFPGPDLLLDHVEAGAFDVKGCVHGISAEWDRGLELFWTAELAIIA
jgi:hypothetical protein